MRNNVLLLTVFLFIAFSCNNTKEKTDITSVNSNEESSLSLKGTWERTSFYNYNDGVVTDTFKSNEANRHIKVFTNKNVMWCRNISADSSEWFGYGSYKITDTLLTETLEYGSVKMSQFIAKNPEFVFKYNLEKDKFSQIQIDEEGHPVFAENYVRLE
ncbi:hypothetical protein [Seonamhaeicola maritimus]|uniref:hypothetical protein n=1 Tax=Seonamhaeicola maritimus TaxID=2591822 RepID=UPI002494F838|nr:hypothetical protein [Seonamhaeicola maritimus]